MTIVGFNFSNIEAKRNKAVQGEVKIQNNVKIEDISETEMTIGQNKQKVLKFTFNYESKYEPKIGNILIKGDLIYMNEPKIITEVLEKWNSKEKKIPENVIGPVINTILNKSSIMALLLTKEVNLPPQLQLPKVKVQ
ncbi:MAG: hypothetical protein ACOC3X_00460 [Nanoarchaeota archaeon]